MSDEVLRARVEALVAMAGADGRVGKREVQLIRVLCQRWGVDDRVLQEVLRNAGHARLSIPSNVEERNTIFKALVRVAAVDGVIDEGELQLLHGFAQRSSIRPEIVQRALENALKKRQAARSKGGSESKSGGVARKAQRPSVAAPPPAPVQGSGAPPPPLDAPPPQKAFPDHPEAKSLALDRKGPEVFGEPPWDAGARRGSTTQCDVCYETIPKSTSSCPFCEVEFDRAYKLRASAAAAARTASNLKPLFFVVGIVLVLGGPYLIGRWRSSGFVESAEAIAQGIGDPKGDQITQAREAELAKQADLQAKIDKAKKTPEAAELAELRAKIAAARKRAESTGSTSLEAVKAKRTRELQDLIRKQRR